MPMLNAVNYIIELLNEQHNRITTDDRLLRKAKKCSNLITIQIENPVTWLMSIFQEETP